MKQNTRSLLALLWRCLGFALGVVGVIMQLMADDVVGGGFMMNHDLAYFTVQTNIFSTLIFGILAGKSLVGLIRTGELEISAIRPGVHLACTCYITITMLGYWLLLFPMSGMPANPFLACSTMALHTVVPLMAILDHAFFAPHGGVKPREIWRWLVYPVCYLLSLVILAGLIREPYYVIPVGGEKITLMYPYPFLDPKVMGVTGSLLAVLGLAVFFTLFGLLFIWADNRRKGEIIRKERKRK